MKQRRFVRWPQGNKKSREGNGSCPMRWDRWTKTAHKSKCTPTRRTKRLSSCKGQRPKLRFRSRATSRHIFRRTWVSAWAKLSRSWLSLPRFRNRRTRSRSKRCKLGGERPRRTCPQANRSTSDYFQLDFSPNKSARKGRTTLSWRVESKKSRKKSITLTRWSAR